MPQILIPDIDLSWWKGKGAIDVNRADSRFAPANERQRYFVTMSLIGWVQT